MKYVSVLLLSIFMFLPSPPDSDIKTEEAEMTVQKHYGEENIKKIIESDKDEKEMSLFVELKNGDIFYVSLEKKKFSFSNIKVTKLGVATFDYVIADEINIKEDDSITKQYESLKDKRKE